PTEQALQAVDILQRADEHALDPAAYGAQDLLQRLTTARDHPLSDEAATALDKALTAAMESFLSDLHLGRVDPRKASANFDGHDVTFNAAFHLHAAVTGNRLAQ